MNDEQRIRDQLEAMARDVPASAGPLPASLRKRARRRAMFTSGVAFLTVMAVGVGAFAGIRTLDRVDRQPAVSPTSAPPTPEVTRAPSPSGSFEGVSPAPVVSFSETVDVVEAGPPPRTLLALGSLLYRVEQDGSLTRAGTLYGVPFVPPVETPFGVVSLGGDGSFFQGQVLLAKRVSGFAVSADGRHIAYSTVDELHQTQARDAPPNSHYVTTLQLMDLRTRSVIATSDPVDNPTSLPPEVGWDFARVEGFIGDRVLIAGGDGGATFASVWDPGSNEVRPLPPGFNSAYATAPSTAQAVIAYGDGGCWQLATFPPDGSDPGVAEGNCDLTEASFTDDGELFAGATRDGRVLVYSAPSCSSKDGFDIPGVRQTVWEDDTTLLALVRSKRDDRDQVWRCEVGGDCTLSWAAPPGYEGVDGFLVPRAG